MIKYNFNSMNILVLIKNRVMVLKYIFCVNHISSISENIHRLFWIFRIILEEDWLSARNTRKTKQLLDLIHIYYATLIIYKLNVLF